MEVGLGSSKGFASKPRALMCYICGREYGTKSLPIHIKACLKKWEIEEEQKPVKNRKPPPQPPADLQTLLGGQDFSMAAMDKYNENAYKKWETEALYPCPNCSRTFREEALKVHLKSCRADRVLNPLPNKKVNQRVEEDENEEEDDDYENSTVGSTIKNKTAGGKFYEYQEDQKNQGLYSNNNSKKQLPSYRGELSQSLSESMSSKVSASVTSLAKDDTRVECRICERKFAADRLEKHQKACAKSNKKRPVFNSKKHRQVEGQGQVKMSSNTRDEPKAANNAKKAKWKRQHDEFIRNIKQAKIITAVEAAGGDIRSIPMAPKSSEEYDDYVTCHFCNRRFDSKVAERHIPKCKDIINRPKPPVANGNSGNKSNTRQKSVSRGETMSQQNSYANEDFKSKVRATNAFSQLSVSNSTAASSRSKSINKKPTMGMNEKTMYPKESGPRTFEFSPQNSKPIPKSAHPRTTTVSSSYNKERDDQQFNEETCFSRATFYATTTCPHCDRKFASKAAERHIPICKTIINKPKPVGADRQKVSLPQLDRQARNGSEKRITSALQQNGGRIIAGTTMTKMSLQPINESKSPSSQQFQLNGANYRSERVHSKFEERKNDGPHSIFCTCCGSRFKEKDKFCGECGDRRS